MLSFLKKLYLKVRNFVALTTVRCFNYGRDLQVAGRREDKFGKKVAGVAMKAVGLLVIACAAVTLVLPLALLAIYAIGPFGMIFGIGLSGAFTTDVLGTVDVFDALVCEAYETDEGAECIKMIAALI